MGTKRHRRGRHLRFDCHPAVIAYLRDEEPDEADTEGRSALAAVEFFQEPDDLREIWKKIRDEILADWVIEFPGTRPSAWWKWDAPEPRQRIGGIGTVKSDFLAYVATFHCGIPTGWASQALLTKGWPIGNNAGQIVWAPLSGVDADPFDPNDPPLFEAQATYLQRKGLLSEAERRRLSPADYEPEAAVLEDCFAEQMASAEQEK